jgi:hypothetical protein
MPNPTAERRGIVIAEEIYCTAGYHITVTNAVNFPAALYIYIHITFSCLTTTLKLLTSALRFLMAAMTVIYFAGIAISVPLVLPMLLPLAFVLPAQLNARTSSAVD